MNTLFGLISRIRVFLLFILLEILAFVLLSNNSYYQHAAIVNGVRTFKLKIDAQLDAWDYFFSLRKTNEHLAQENAALRNRIERYESLMSDTLKNKDALDTLGRPLYSYIPAAVVTNSVFDLHNYITLNVGSEAGVERGMGVIVHDGLVGTIVSVDTHYSLAISLLNVNWKVSAKLARNGAFGSMHWDGKNYREVLLTEIPQHIPVAVGDTIVSSGYSAMFPPEVPIGTVQSFSIKRGNFYEITVALFADFKQIHYVEVVNHLYRTEIKTLESPANRHD